MANETPLLATRNVIKRFGGVAALKGVSLTVEAGSVHGLLGENGAGKSTLVKIVAGLHNPTEGEVLLDGTPLGPVDVKAMERHGVFLVTQEPAIVNPLSVAENLMLGRWPRRGPLVDVRAMRRLATEYLEGTGLDPLAPAGRLSAVDRRKLNILRALHSGGRLIILDEPTTALTMADRRVLFDFMRKLKQDGVTFMFISHYNEEILEICDAVSVLRDGLLVAGNQPVAAVSSDALSEMVLGRGLALFARHDADRAKAEAPSWNFTGIKGRGFAVDRLALAPGEIVGFAGLPGSGAGEVARAIYGLLPAQGTVTHNGATKPLPAEPAAGLAAGIAFLSEDRLKDGIVGIHSIASNISLSSLGRMATGGVVWPGRERALVADFFKRLAIKARGAEQPVGQLSGGNQQKVLLSRLLATKPRLLILNEPTRGIDVGVKEEVHRLIDGLTREGVSVIIVTSDLDEMLRTVDRMVLFAGGRIVGDHPAGTLTKDDVLRIAFSTGGPDRVPPPGSARPALLQHPPKVLAS
ncbi:sugar ABC transporter ATP-binding protein [Lichenihabitans sp. Uapishka_5]|uniref:sugar ABC transporter ATP-binding protein n=1 Tax=Lichenihabitans sp. Uapishka_5 TaxID=3037302 RepID=UPI0029E819E4|nr:sugar ABC transporter ATP-binding protein [Lichenihabitans sp. Uapishka_5]MDX7950823.1 sugar ABC transporter ATP-binding protein [Lichenihabitans sp. Uapishka_5]